ncbi:hypothetical protein KUCAC02_014616 [Chaenocephalus aceratus]|uniref:Uncharacterized protein n=1 Tax=Chaenocephalus aceratus TaxID=36190 RepID=A0ACB9WFV7_CHAAC|nr:hypothetical protein KUCAC02_014616 [Chaenocephalus aceratus]
MCQSTELNPISTDPTHTGFLTILEKATDMAENTEQNEAKHDSSSSPGVTDQEKEIAASAYEAYLSGKYDESLKHLETLQDLNKEDYKIAMNKAVVEFYKSSQTTTGTLKQTLLAMKNQVHTSAEDIDGLDDVENSWLYYNQAIIHYHMRQYSDAIAIGERLYQLRSWNRLRSLLRRVLPAGGPVPAHLPAREGPPPAGCAGQTVHNRKQQERQRREFKQRGANQKAEFTAMMEAAKSKMHQYKREIKSVMNTAGNSAPSLFLRSILDPSRRGNVFDLGDGSNAHAKKFTGIPMCALLANKRYELLYNCGIQLLHIGRPLAAFDGSEQESKGLPCKKGIVQSIVGQGYHRKIILASQSTQNTIYSEGQSAAIPVASMEFAAIGLRNALLLLPEHQQDAKTENGSKICSQAGSTESGNENSDPCRSIHMWKGPEADKFLVRCTIVPSQETEVENLRCSILACSAYVALALETNLMPSALYAGPGSLYAAEARISLDRISDAIGHLDPENVSDVSMGVLRQRAGPRFRERRRACGGL